MTDDPFRIALAIFDGIAGLVLAVVLLSDTMLRFPKWHRFFIAIGAAGMLSQSVLLIAEINGYSVSEVWWTWAAKDICIGGLALTYALLALRGRETTLAFHSKLSSAECIPRAKSKTN